MTVDASYYKGTGSRCGKERDIVLCMATGQSHAEILPDLSPTLNCNCEQPILVHPQIAGVCAADTGLSRPNGTGNEVNVCIASAGFRHKAGSTAGSIGYGAEIAPTLMAAQPSGVFAFRSLVRNGENAGGQQGIDAEHLQWKSTVRRLTPLECERLQGFPDRWTEYGHNGQSISDTKRYTMLGNSVAVPCVAYIMQGIRQALARR